MVVVQVGEATFHLLGIISARVHRRQPMKLSLVSAGAGKDQARIHHAA